MTDPTEALPETWDEADAQAKEKQAEDGSAAGQQVEDTGQGGNAQPGTSSIPELSFLNDGSRQMLASALEGMDPEQAKALVDDLKGGYMRDKRFTELRQKEKEELRRIRDLAKAGEQWATLKSDDDAMRDFISLMSERLGDTPQQPEALPEDLFVRDPNEAIGPLEQRFERMLEKKLDQRLQQFEAQQRAPVEHAESLKAAVGEWVEEQPNGINDETVIQASNEMAKDLGIGNLTPYMVKRLLPRYVDIVTQQAAAQAQQQANQSKRETLRQARAASPRGGVGAAAPGGHDFKSKLEDFRKKMGREPRTDERSDMAFDEILKQRGISEEEMDQEIRGPRSKR